jgi:hypothetical protein
MQLGGKVQPCSYSVPSPHRLFKNSSLFCVPALAIDGPPIIGVHALAGVHVKCKCSDPALSGALYSLNR